MLRPMTPPRNTAATADGRDASVEEESSTVQLQRLYRTPQLGKAKQSLGPMMNAQLKSFADATPSTMLSENTSRSTDTEATSPRRVVSPSLSRWGVGKCITPTSRRDKCKKSKHKSFRKSQVEESSESPPPPPPLHTLRENISISSSTMNVDPASTSQKPKESNNSIRTTRSLPLTVPVRTKLKDADKQKDRRKRKKKKKSEPLQPWPAVLAKQKSTRSSRKPHRKRRTTSSRDDPEPSINESSSGKSSGELSRLCANLLFRYLNRYDIDAVHLERLCRSFEHFVQQEDEGPRQVLVSYRREYKAKNYHGGKEGNDDDVDDASMNLYDVVVSKADHGICHDEEEGDDNESLGDAQSCDTEMYESFAEDSANDSPKPEILAEMEGFSKSLPDVLHRSPTPESIHLSARIPTPFHYSDTVLDYYCDQANKRRLQHFASESALDLNRDTFDRRGSFAPDTYWEGQLRKGPSQESIDPNSDTVRGMGKYDATDEHSLFSVTTRNDSFVRRKLQQLKQANSDDEGDESPTKSSRMKHVDNMNRTTSLERLDSFILRRQKQLSNERLDCTRSLPPSLTIPEDLESSDPQRRRHQNESPGGVSMVALPKRSHRREKFQSRRKEMIEQFTRSDPELPFIMDKDSKRPKRWSSRKDTQSAGDGLRASSSRVKRKKKKKIRQGHSDKT